MRARRRSGRAPRGAAAVEAALVLPVFFVFAFGLFLYGHMQMVASLMMTACQNAARYGSTEGVSTAEVRERVLDQLAGALSATQLTAVDVMVKDANAFDTGSDLPGDAQAYREHPEWFTALPNIETATAPPRRLFLVRAVVDYNQIAILRLPFMEGGTLVGQSISRHE